MAAYKVHSIYPYDNEQGREIQQIGNKLLGKRNTKHVEQFIQAMPIAAGAAKAAIESILAFSAPNLKSKGITRLPKKIPMTMPIPATARSVIRSSGELIGNS